MKKSLLLICFTIFIVFFNIVPAYAAPLDPYEAAESRKSLPVETNKIPNWPPGPLIGAQAAILMDIESGAILYDKNIDEQLYPASTTKIMTALLVLENSKLDEIVSFSHNSIFSIERDSSNIGIDVGEKMTMEECLYGILLGSANEVCVAVAEHVAGSEEAFVKMMNARASELGCENTRFLNTNGLPNDAHYTSAKDLALISAAFFKNEIGSKIAGTTKRTLNSTATQPDDIYLINHHTMLKGLKNYYESIVGGKTGYTVAARQTLVSCAEKDGMRLVCVILKEEAPHQYRDTEALFNYGFDNFHKINISENEQNFTISNDNFFNTKNTIFGTTNTALLINPEGYVLVPKTVEFYDITADVSYGATGENSVASLNYYYQNAFVGKTNINYTSSANIFKFGPATGNAIEIPIGNNQKTIIFINIRVVILWIVFIFFIFIAMFSYKAFSANFNFSGYRRSRIKKKRGKYNSKHDNLHF